MPAWHSLYQHTLKQTTHYVFENFRHKCHSCHDKLNLYVSLFFKSTLNHFLLHVSNMHSINCCLMYLEVLDTSATRPILCPLLPGFLCSFTLETQSVHWILYQTIRDDNRFLVPGRKSVTLPEVWWSYFDLVGEIGGRHGALIEPF